ncbi:MAG: winged helix-turn-helix transcriptional regulator [Cognatishimia sp.]|uniref:MarR family winged helix-turn-helix transcriptional regulator n=1 Tax=Cognatishimia sp. TaxID=2211648 RepID=UPI003B8C76D3
MSDDLPAFDLEHYVPYQFSIISAQLSANLATMYQDRFGISVAEWRILVNLAYSDSRSVRDIQRRVRLDKAKVSRAVAQLENRGFLTKEIDGDDRRLLHLELTASGRDLVAQLVPLAEEFQSTVAAKLNGEFAALQTNLTQLMKELSDG